MVLHDLTDKLNEALNAAEELLRSFNFGCQAETSLSIYEKLGFIKIGNVFRLAYKPSEESEWMLAVRASRSVRIRIPEHLDDLLTALRNAYEGDTTQVRIALEQTWEWIGRNK